MPVIHFIRPKLAIVTIVLSILLIASFAFAAVSFAHGHHSACQARDTTLDVMRDILVSAAAQTDGNPKVSREQKRASDQFVSQSLARINKARC